MIRRLLARADRTTVRRAHDQLAPFLQEGELIDCFEVGDVVVEEGRNDVFSTVQVVHLASSGLALYATVAGGMTIRIAYDEVTSARWRGQLATFALAGGETLEVRTLGSTLVPTVQQHLANRRSE